MPIVRSYYELPRYSVNDVAEAWGLCYHLFNVLKYCIRAYEKNGIADIDKALTYLDRLESLEFIPRATPIGDIEFQDLHTAWGDILTVAQKSVLLRISEFKHNSGTKARLPFLREKIQQLRAEVAQER